MTQALNRKIFAGCKELHLDNDTRKDLQLQVVGKSSLSDMDDAEKKRVIKELQNRGFKASSKGRLKRPVAKRADVRFVHVLWGLLKQNDCLDNPTREGLNAFIRKRFGDSWGASLIDVDAMEDHRQISDVINALKAWCDRKGIDHSGGGK